MADLMLPGFDPRYPDAKKRSPRTQAWHRRAAERLSTMHRRFGTGPDGQTCKGCVHLVQYTPGGKSFLKCDLAGVSRSESTDWRAKWQSCGRFELRPENPT